jgi:hypothetical protein
LRTDGFRFNPFTGSVATIPEAPLEPRSDPATVWTGEEFLMWGGWQEGPPFSGDGAAYNPSTDTWRQLPPAPISARVPLSAWTGEEWILWGTGVRVDDRPLDGAAYNPSTDTWRPIADGPVAFTDATAMWTGREFVVVGAALHGGNVPETPTAVAAAYDPRTDSWRELPASPLDPNSNTAVWAEDRIVGVDYNHVTAGYDPATDSWSQMERFPGDECEGGLAQAQAAQGWVVVVDCGAIATLRPGAERWSVTDDGPKTPYPRTLPAGDAVLVFDPRGDLWSFRPTSSETPQPSATVLAEGIARGTPWELITTADRPQRLELRWDDGGPGPATQSRERLDVASEMQVGWHTFGRLEPDDAVVFGAVPPQTATVKHVPGQGLPETTVDVIDVPGADWHAFVFMSYAAIGIVTTEDAAGQRVGEFLIVPAECEPMLETVEAFLAARLAGADAEAFLTPEALERFGRQGMSGLYSDEQGSTFERSKVLFVDGPSTIGRYVPSCAVGVRLISSNGGVTEETLAVGADRTGPLIVGAQSGVTGP